MPVRIGSARHDERGKISGGKAGDQTGKEVSRQDWYRHPKDWVMLRAKDPAHARLIADAMDAACDNDKIGYDQGQNQTLWAEAKKVGFDPSKVKVLCETDCARLVRVCVTRAGISVADFYTATEAATLMATGAFTKHTAAKYTASDKYLRRGDILVTKIKGHTVVVLSDGVHAYADSAMGARDLKRGSAGDDVRELQILLISMGFSCGKWGADGDFGSGTEAAVVAWQYANGLPETGVVDADDYAMIKRLLNPEEDEPDDGPDDTDTDTEPDDGDAPMQYVSVSSGNTVNVRTAPVTGAVLGIAYLGNAFEYLGETSSDGWRKIQFGDDAGWISGKYTALAGEAEPVAPPDVPATQEKPNALIVDISQHNNLKHSKNDWAKIAKNVDLLVLRCGVTRTDTAPKGIGIDAEFAYAAKKCIEHGIPFGVYYYGKVKTADEARKEARKAFETASPYKPLFYAYDVEEGRLTNACLKAFADELRKLGVKKVGLYVGHNYYPQFEASVGAFDFPWIPRYGKNDGTYKAKYDPAYPCDIHQYSSLGAGHKLGFYDDTVDINRLTGSKPLSWFLSE